MFCPKCGYSVSAEALFCGSCGQPLPPSHTAASTPSPDAGAVTADAPASPSTPKPRKKSRGIVRAIFSLPFAFLLIALPCLIVSLLFVHALSEHIELPAIGPLSSDLLTDFFKTPFPFILCGVLFVLPITILFFLNAPRIRRAFSFTGISIILSAFLCTAVGLFVRPIVTFLPNDWHQALASTTSVFKDFALVCAAILLIVGILFLSIYFCVIAAKGGNHENT